MTKKKKVMIGAALAVVLLAVVVIVYVMSQPTVIDLEDCVTVSYSGYNTVGEAAVSWDDNKLDMLLTKALDTDSSFLSSLAEYLVCRNAISFTVDKDKGLSNGDEVLVTFLYDNEAVKDCKVKFTGKTAKFLVEGLPDFQEIDPFDDLEVSFSGISSSGRVEMSYTGNVEHLGAYGFFATPLYDLKNGDSVKISIGDYIVDNLTRSGYTVTKTSKEYLVEGLDEYVSAYQDIPQEFVEELKRDAQKAIRDYADETYEEECALGPLTYAGYVFTETEDSDGTIFTPDANDLYLIYQGTISHSSGIFDDTVIYFPVAFRNIITGKTGPYYEEGSDIEGTTFVGDSPWTYGTKGYADPHTAYQELTTHFSQVLENQVGDGFEKFKN